MGNSTFPEWTEHDWAEIYDCLYQGAMAHGAAMPAFPSYLKGHQRVEEYRREELSTEEKKTSIRAEIRRLQAELDAIEEEERNNTPHKQLTLFEQ
jgi:hypothetical protein